MRPEVSFLRRYNAWRKDLAPWHGPGTHPDPREVSRVIDWACTQIERQSTTFSAPSGYWRRPDQYPEQPTSAIISIPSDDGLGWHLKNGIYITTPNGWQNEATGEPLDEAEYLWMPETALLEGLEVPA